MIHSKHRFLKLPALLLLLPMLVFAGCAPAPAAQSTSDPAAAATAADAPALKTFTADELAKWDGKNGNPAYVAVDGTVYDVSDVPEWKDGIHQGRFQAGRDLSKEIMQSPHGKARLKNVPVVGTLVE